MNEIKRNNFDLIPDEMFLKILQDLSDADTLTCSTVSQTFRAISHDPSLWKGWVTSKKLTLLPSGPFDTALGHVIRCDSIMAGALGRKSKFENDDVKTNPFAAKKYLSRVLQDDDSSSEDSDDSSSMDGRDRLRALFKEAVKKPMSFEDFLAWMDAGVAVTPKMLRSLAATGISQDTLRKIILAILDQDAYAVEILTQADLFSDKEIILAAFQKMVAGMIKIAPILEHLDPKDITFEIARKAVKLSAEEFQYVPRDIEGYEEIVWATVKRWLNEKKAYRINASFVRHIPSDFEGISRIESMLRNSSQPDRTMYGFAPHDIPPSLALQAVTKRPKCLKYIPHTIRRYREIVEAALEAKMERKASCQGIIKYIHHGLFTDPEFAMNMVKICPQALNRISPTTPTYREIVEAALEAEMEREGSYKGIIKYIDQGLFTDPEFAMNMVKVCPQALERIPPTAPHFSEMAHLAVKVKGNLLRHVPYDTNGYDSIAEEAIQENYAAISFVRIPSNSSAYRDLLMKAIQKDYRVLECAAQECRNDPSIAIVAIRKDPRAIECVRKVLRYDIPCLLSVCDNAQEKVEIAASILRTVDDLDPETTEGLLQFIPDDDSFVQYVFDRDVVTGYHTAADIRCIIEGEPKAITLRDLMKLFATMRNHTTQQRRKNSALSRDVHEMLPTLSKQQKDLLYLMATSFDPGSGYYQRLTTRYFDALRST